ncbi:glycerate kinase [Lentzea sp. NBC_00516]|uniref:glycerate kinase family protein n=1 Tax=Lentzea sp. NBC_00516 TaxID=2903582 RepID=UPI002E8119F3|nr:glycerate kinase [Lentzea sp. NBC_00516]WUD28633.1 glycerate kinase [Lentzea sp. NBC_00516]
MRFLVAPSGFKESLDACEVADAIEQGIYRVVPGAVVDKAPLVDGGEGSAKALAEATGGRLVPALVTGPIGEQVPAGFALLGGPGPRTAVVEMAAAAGLRLVPNGHRDPATTTTYGVGELVLAALDLGVDRILVGCGDSGTSDGGAGALQALGARITDARGREIERGGAALLGARALDLSEVDPRLDKVEITVACNQHNVLCGDRGVARVFGPQKGATPAQVELLAAALDNWADLLGPEVRTIPGGGASGGLGAGLHALNATLVPRFEVMLEHSDLDARLPHADLVITAEGAIDGQTPHGKVPAEVARRAKRHGKPVIALAGTIGENARATHDVGIDAYASIIAAPVALDVAMATAAALLTDATERTLRLVLVGAALT